MKFYQENAVSYAESTFNKDFAKAVFSGMESVISMFPKSRAILDIGCGSGRDAEHLSSLGYEVHAFDQSEEMIKAGVSQAKNTFLTGTSASGGIRSY